MKSMMAAAMPKRAKPVSPALNQVFTPGMSLAWMIPSDFTSGKLSDQKTVVRASIRTARKCREGETAAELERGVLMICLAFSALFFVR